MSGREGAAGIFRVRLRISVHLLLRHHLRNERREGARHSMELWFDNGAWYCRTQKDTYHLTAEEAEGFVSANMREPTLAGLVSPPLALQIMCLFLEDGEPPRAFARPMMDVVAAVTAPDGVPAPERSSWEKAHAPLKGAKLRSLGVGHKHVSLARHMLVNAALAISPRRPEHAAALENALVDSAGRTHAATDGDLDAVAEAMTALVTQRVGQRISDKNQTGDWIVFEVVGGRPYFLCLFQHPADGERQCDEELAQLVQFVRNTWKRPDMVAV